MQAIEGEGLALNKGPSQVKTGLDETAQEENSMKTAAKLALVGYARVDIIKLKIKFGQWNPRILVKQQSKLLAESFKREGCSRFSPEYFIPLITRRSYLKEDTLTQDPDQQEDLPILQFSPNIPTTAKIYGASGQHRLDALKKWIALKREEYRSVNAEAVSMEQQVDELDEEDRKYYNHRLKPQRDNLKALVSLEGQWGVSVYDEGE